MKFRSLILLSIIVLPTVYATQAQDLCIQFIQPAVSPNGVCQEFANPCIVPADWKSIPSCNLVNQSVPQKTSLESRMDNRITLMNAYWNQKKAEQKESETNTRNKNYNRIGSGSITRSARNKRLPTSSPTSRIGVRTVTEKDYGSDIAKRYSLRGGYQRAGDATAEERQTRRAYRPAMMSATDAVRSGDLKTTINWNILSRQFTNSKNYNPNPYTVRSKYLEEQKANRKTKNQEIDVYERMMSRSRVYRGKRMDGNLDESSLLK